MTSSRLRDPRIRKDKSPLYLQARRQILAMIGAGRFRPGSQLPPEDVLAETLGVSRPTVREALALLQIDGIVTRRHGAGNFVNHLPFNISARIDELISIPEALLTAPAAGHRSCHPLGPPDAGLAAAAAVKASRRRLIRHQERQHGFQPSRQQRSEASGGEAQGERPGQQ